MGATKRFAHDVEYYNGKLGLLAVTLQEQLQQPATQAILIAAVSIIGAAVSFYSARGATASS